MRYAQHYTSIATFLSCYLLVHSYCVNIYKRIRVEFSESCKRDGEVDDADAH